jgi:hypothetical protein
LELGFLERNSEDDEPKDLEAVALQVEKPPKAMPKD